LLVTSVGLATYFSCFYLMKRLKGLLRFTTSRRFFRGRDGWVLARLGGILPAVNGRLRVVKK
jgi:hypothetical protein